MLTFLCAEGDAASIAGEANEGTAEARVSDDITEPRLHSTTDTQNRRGKPSNQTKENQESTAAAQHSTSTPMTR